LKKYITVFILTLFLIGAGTIYASSNPVKSFATWYDSAFQLKAEKLGSVTATGLITGFSGFNRFVKESKQSIGASIANLSDDRSRQTQADILARQYEMLGDLNETAVELQKENFDDYLETRNMEAEISQEVEKMLEELLNE